MHIYHILKSSYTFLSPNNNFNNKITTKLFEQDSEEMLSRDPGTKNPPLYLCGAFHLQSPFTLIIYLFVNILLSANPSSSSNKLD